MTDVIVIGLGADGGAAAAHLARRGARVLGIEAFSRGHTNGSSGGLTRVIRLAYYEHPDYVPLLKRAWTSGASSRPRAVKSSSGRPVACTPGLATASSSAARSAARASIPSSTTS